MTLEEKIKEYLIKLTNKCRGWVAEEVAKDIAEIAEKEYMLNAIVSSEQNSRMFDEAIYKLEKQNSDLKVKLDNVKYLDRDKVEKVIRKGLRASVNREHYISDKSLDNKITNILSLAIPVIDKERIIRVLESYAEDMSNTNFWDVAAQRFNEYLLTTEIKDIFKTIANEILNNKE